MDVAKHIGVREEYLGTKIIHDTQKKELQRWNVICILRVANVLFQDNKHLSCRMCSDTSKCLAHKHVFVSLLFLNLKIITDIMFAIF